VSKAKLTDILVRWQTLLQRWPAWKGTQLSAAQSALHHGLPDYAEAKIN